MRQIDGANQIGGLLGNIDRILEHAQFRTGIHRRIRSGYSLLLCIHRSSRKSQRLLVFIGKSHFLVHRNAAKLTEKHLGEHQTVFCLGNLHLRLVHLYIYLQTICLGGYALLNHLVNIVIELFHQVSVAGGELVLLLQRNGKPVSLVYAVEGLLGLHVEIIVCYLLTDVCYLVGSQDGAAHIDRLANHHASCPDVAGVGAESIYHALSDGIALLLDNASFLVEQSSDFLCLFRGEHSLVYQIGHHVVGIAGDSTYDVGTQIAEC